MAWYLVIIYLLYIIYLYVVIHFKKKISIFHRMSVNTMLLSPLMLRGVRFLSVGKTYTLKTIPCYYSKKGGKEMRARAPRQERDAQLGLERRWQVTKIQHIFQHYATIIAFHITYKPRKHYEEKLDWDLVEAMEELGVEGKYYPRHCFGNYLRYSRYKHMLPLFTAPTGIIYTNDPLKVPDICKLLLTVQPSKHMILGGLMDGKLYGPNTFVELGKLDDLKSEQVKLVSLLSKPSVDLVQNLSYPSALLSRALQQKTELANTDSDS